MKTTLRSMLMAGALAYGSAALAQAPATGTQGGAHAGHGEAKAQMDPSAGHSKMGSDELHQHMQTSAQKMSQMPMTGDLEHDFMASMRQHHLDGIEMSKVALKHAKDAKARQFAQKTIRMQEKDVKELDAWLAKHKARSATGGAGMEATQPATDTPPQGQ